MRAATTINYERKLLAWFFYSYILFVFLIEALSHHLIHQLAQPVLTDPGADNTYWLLHLLNIPQFIAGSGMVSVLFELSLLVVILLCLVFPQENRLSILFSIMFMMYLVTKNSYVAHHEHGLDLPLLMSFIFWIRNEQRFVILFKAFRFYLVFVFVSAALWKIFRGGIFLPWQFSEILKTQHFFDLVNYRESMYMRFITWLINHPLISRWLLICSTALQLSFVVGFFTRRFDKVLLILFFLFFIANYLLMNLSFYQWFICSVVFLPWNSLNGKDGRSPLEQPVYVNKEKN